MAAEEDPFENHALVTRARSIKALINDLAELNESDQISVTRLRAALDYIEVHLRASDPSLVSDRLVSAIDETMAEIETHLTSLRDSPEVVVSSSIRESVESLLYKCVDFPVVGSVADLAPVRTAIESLASFAASEREKLSAELAGLREEIEKAKPSLTSSHESVAEKITAAETAVQELTAAVETQKNEIKAAAESQSTAFTTSETERKSEFKAFLNDLQTEHTTIQNNVIKKGEDTVKEVLERAQELEKQIEKRRDEVDNTAEAVGLAATIRGFRGYADQQKRIADWWRFGAIAALLAIVVLGLWTLKNSVDGDLDLQRSLIKGSIGTALATIAGYSGRQSSHHRREERAARRLGLEVAAFDPFIANLPEDRQLALKEFMTLRIFGHLEDEAAEADRWGDHHPSAQSVLALIKKDRSE